MSILFTPIRIGSVTVPNRFVRSATHDYMADDEGFVTDANVELLARLAEGEVGLIISGHANVQPVGKASPRQMGVFDDRFVQGLARLPEAVHRFPSKVFLQIAHAGRQTKERDCGGVPVSPSPVYDPVTKVMPRELAAEEVRALVADFVAAAVRAKAGRVRRRPAPRRPRLPPVELPFAPHQPPDRRMGRLAREPGPGPPRGAPRRQGGVRPGLPGHGQAQFDRLPGRRPVPRRRGPRRRDARGRRHRRDRGERRHGRGRPRLGLAGSPRARTKRAISWRTRPGSRRPCASPSAAWAGSGRSPSPNASSAKDWSISSP